MITLDKIQLDTALFTPLLKDDFRPLVLYQASAVVVAPGLGKSESFLLKAQLVCALDEEEKVVVNELRRALIAKLDDALADELSKGFKALA